MYYEDEARRFNFLSGLLCGGVLGVGLTLLLVPQAGARRRAPRALAGALKRGRGLAERVGR